MGYDFIAQNSTSDNNRMRTAGVMNRFGYLQDRLFGVSLTAYAGKRPAALARKNNSGHALCVLQSHNCVVRKLAHATGQFSDECGIQAG